MTWTNWTMDFYGFLRCRQDQSIINILHSFRTGLADLFWLAKVAGKLLVFWPQNLKFPLYIFSHIIWSICSLIQYVLLNRSTYHSFHPLFLIKLLTLQDGIRIFRPESCDDFALQMVRATRQHSPHSPYSTFRVWPWVFWGAIKSDEILLGKHWTKLSVLLFF